ncbi:MAG: hypothetical protein HKO62_05850, partial [Gammaproteobacteria bacterium]|nr:hypothetical protein [Gammaproteobacteria bacterium]
EISGPVRTDFGWHLLQLVDIKPPINISFEDAKAEIRKYMVLPKKNAGVRRATRRQYLTGLRQKYAVTINQEVVEAMAPELPVH